MTDPSWLVCFAVGSLKFADVVVVVDSFVFIFSAVVLANPSQKWMHSRVGCKTPCAISHLEVQQKVHTLILSGYPKYWRNGVLSSCSEKILEIVQILV